MEKDNLESWFHVNPRIPAISFYLHQMCFICCCMCNDCIVLTVETSGKSNSIQVKYWKWFKLSPKWKRSLYCSQIAAEILRWTFGQHLHFICLCVGRCITRLIKKKDASWGGSAEDVFQKKHLLSHHCCLSVLWERAAYSDSHSEQSVVCIGLHCLSMLGTWGYNITCLHQKLRWFMWAPCSGIWSYKMS